MKSPRGRAFTTVEFMVLFGIVVILLSIFVPVTMQLREKARRSRCADNLRQIYGALASYAAANATVYPRVRYDEPANPSGYVAFTGADDPDPFSAQSSVAPNDVTASLWLLVRLGLVDAGVFICPSSDNSRDLMTDAQGRFVRAVQRGNFRRPSNLSYSYCSPFSNAPNYRMNVDRPGDFALLADKNPGIAPPDADVTGVPVDADLLRLSHANSRNHGRAGQNVLSAQGSVLWRKSPYCGVQGDNIYTALSRTPLIDRNLPPRGSGFLGYDIGPSWEGDSYLLPTATDGLNAGVVPRAATALTSSTAPAASAPTTMRASAPATHPASAPASAPATQPQ